MDLLLEERHPIVVEQPPRSWRLTRRGRWAIVITSCGVLATLVGYLVADQVQQGDQFNQSRAALAGAQHHISAGSAQLASVQHDLLVLTHQLGNDTTAFDQAASQLKAAQTALGAAQAHVTQQASLITSLQTCLGGVQQALNAFAVDNRKRSFRLLESVSSSCTTAAAASG